MESIFLIFSKMLFHFTTNQITFLQTLLEVSYKMMCLGMEGSTIEAKQSLALFSLKTIRDFHLYK